MTRQPVRLPFADEIGLIECRYAQQKIAAEPMTVRIDSSRCSQEFGGMILVSANTVIAASVLDVPLMRLFQAPLAMLSLNHSSWACAR